MVSATPGSLSRSASVTVTVRVSPGTDVGVMETLPSVPPPTTSSSVTVAVPPEAVKASLYVTVTVSPDCVLKVPSLSVPPVVPKVVSTVPVNTPVFTPVSVSVTFSSSPVSVFSTDTTIVSATPGSVSRSASVTVTVSVSPGTDVGVMLTEPSAPPPTTSSAVSVAVPPDAVKASL